MSKPTEGQREVAHVGHGEGAGADEEPSAAAEWTVFGLSSALVAVTIYLAIRYLIWPGETSEDHIKRRILREEDP